MKVILHTEANPEDNAMLQALYSRSPKSVTEHLEKLSQVGSGKFMEQFYLGYGHASIADCGFVTLYFEGISMLAAKAIEDNPLFNGQECSSRYIDFSNQPFINPFPAGTEEHAFAHQALEACRSFYVKNLDPVLDDLEKRYPRDPSVSEIVYYKALKAKAFDILRGFLPAGATTNVAWTTSLRKAHERLVSLMHHPLAEIRQLAGGAYLVLFKTYPHSFKKEYAEVAESVDFSLLKKMEGDDAFKYRSLPAHFYAPQTRSPRNAWLTKGSVRNLEVELLWPQPFDISEEAKSRPCKEVLTRHSIDALSVLKMELTLDYGSFRDLQRHRGGYCSNPVLDSGNGFHPWYYENLNEKSKTMADSLFEEISAAKEAIVHSSEDRGDIRLLKFQYITPMGVLVPVVLLYPLSQAVYVAELRSGKTVHPTLRPVAQDLARYLSDHNVPVYADMDESDWTVRRGSQDIVPK